MTDTLTLAQASASQLARAVHTGLYALARAPFAAPATPATDGCTSKYKVSLNLLDGATAPGLSALQHFINIAGVVAILICLLGAIAGIVVSSGGGVIGIRHAAQTGRMMIIGGVIGAFAVGLVVVLINYAMSQGLNTHC